MADTLVGRITGQTRAVDVNIELQLMMPLDTLINPDDHRPTIIPEYGPLPAGMAWEIVIRSQGHKWWRRLFTPPSDAKGHCGPIVSGDPTRRCFDGWLAKLIRLRDQMCRDPFCDARIRHIDHITRYSDGARTTYINGAASANAGTSFGKCPAGGSSSLIAASTAVHTRS